MISSLDEEKLKQIYKERENLISATSDDKPSSDEIIEETKERPNLGKVDLTKGKDVSTFPNMGYKRLVKETLSLPGMVYPDDLEIFIRPATVKEIRHFSTIDENDWVDVNDKLNYIIDNCVKFRSATNPNFSWKDLLEIDRFYIILNIRELTFVEGENKLYVTYNCKECGHSGNVELKKENIKLFNLDDRLLKFYDKNTKSFLIRSKSGITVEVFLPTLGVMQYIANYVKRKIQNNEGYDKNFIKVAPFLIRDWRELSDKFFRKKQEEYYSYGAKEISFIRGIVDIIIDSVNPEFTFECSNCFTIGSSPIFFQHGIKSLFLYNIFDELD